MKRDSINNTLPYVYKHYSLFFWKKCRCCNKEFKREHGFRILDGPIYNTQLKESYVCGECANSIESVKEIINKQNQTLKVRTTNCF
jgi:hypothetical protein